MVQVSSIRMICSLIPRRVAHTASQMLQIQSGSCLQGLNSADLYGSHSMVLMSDAAE